MAKRKKIKLKKGIKSVNVLIAIVCAIVMIAGAFIPYFSCKTSVAILGSSTQETNGFGLIEALFTDTEAENYESEGTLADTFASAKLSEENGGKVKFMLICALVVFIFGCLAALASVYGLFAPKSNIKMIIGVVFFIGLAFSVIGAILSANIATAMSANASVFGVSLGSIEMKALFGFYMPAIGALLGVASSVVKL